MSVYDYVVKNAAGDDVRLSDYRGRVLLIVNTASKCCFTPQYQGLQELANHFGEDLAVLAFPCNQFGAQEPGQNSDIQSFCQVNYGVTFPVMAKVDVNGKTASPLFVYLKEAMPGLLGSEAIKWNFTKFLLDRQGNPIKRYAPTDTPERVGRDIKGLISQS